MAIPKKGSRRIVVDGQTYLWRIRQKATYSQKNGWGGLVVAVQHVEQPHATLVGLTSSPRAGNWLELPTTPVTPAIVASLIREARSAGWCPAKSGGSFFLHLNS